jgi:hypothetical protein
MTPLWLVQWNRWHRCDVHCGVIDTTVTCTAESLTPLCTSQRSNWHCCAAMQIWKKFQRSRWLCCDVHSGVIATAVIGTAELLTPLCKYDTAMTFGIIFSRLWLPLKGISIEKTYIGQLSYTIPITFTHKKWGLTRDHFLSQRSHWLHLWQKSAISKSISSANTIPYSKRP